jgi:hypothetical protein
MPSGKNPEERERPKPAAAAAKVILLLKAATQVLVMREV